MYKLYHNDARQPRLLEEEEWRRLGVKLSFQLTPSSIYFLPFVANVESKVKNKNQTAHVKYVRLCITSDQNANVRYCMLIRLLTKGCQEGD